MDGIGLLEALDHDPRPTLVYEIPASAESIRAPAAFYNPALKSQPNLLDSIVAATGAGDASFRDWLLDPVFASEKENKGINWSSFIVSGRWRVVYTDRQAVHSTTLRTTICGLREDELLPTNNGIKPSNIGPNRGKRKWRDAEEAAVPERSEGDVSEKLSRIYRSVELALVGMVEILPTGRVVQANEAWLRQTGHTRDIANAAEFSFMDYVFEEDKAVVTDAWKTVAAGQTITFEMRWNIFEDHEKTKLGKDGRWVLAACVPVFAADGTVILITACTTDISAQKRAELHAVQRAEALERAEESEKKFSRFAELCPAAIYIYDANRVLQYCNDKFLEMLRSSLKPSEKHVLGSVTHPEDIPLVLNAWKKCTEEKVRVDFQFRLKHTWRSDQGEEGPAWVLGSSSPDLDENGNVKAVLGVATEISQFKWAEAVQRSRTEDALEAKRQQENFIDMTSHEMRNPLSAVVQCADSIIMSLNDIAGLLATPNSEDKIREYINHAMEAVQTILFCSAHQKRIVDDILTFSKLDAKLLIITPVAIQPVNLMWDALKMFELESERSETTIEMKQEDSIRQLGIGLVMLDPSRVLQVLINLLTNAIKFTRTQPVKRITVSIGASTKRLPEVYGDVKFFPTKGTREDITLGPSWGNGEHVYLVFTVEDTGRGLREEEETMLFSRFSQASPRTHIRYGGSGLGLFISRELTELQGGEIGVSSELGVGSRFVFYVKSRRASSSQSAPETPPVAASAKPSSFPPPDCTILVVEDNLINQKVLSQQLRKLGCKTLVAGNGEEALDILKTTRYWKGLEKVGRPLQLILMDIEMPIMDGLTCAREVRKKEASGDISGHVPIIAVTANARSEQVAEARLAGMDDVISKPFRMQDLIRRAEHMLNKLSSTSGATRRQSE